MKHIRLMLLLTLALLMLVLGAGIASAQGGGETLSSDDPPYPCPYPGGAFYQPGLFPRYDVTSHSLVLADMATNATVRVLDSFDANVRIINWSPDCRYLTGAVGEIVRGIPQEQLAEVLPYRTINDDYVRWSEKAIVLWDATEGGRIHAVPNSWRFLNNPAVIWSSDASRALVLGGRVSSGRRGQAWRWSQDFLWLRDTNISTRLGDLPTESSTWNRGNFDQYFWDEAHGWIWSSDAGGVVVFDTTTAAEVAYYDNINTGAESRFVFSSDGTILIIYTIARPGWAGTGAITLYNLTTGEPTQINVEGFAAPPIPAYADYHPVALSTDNRYLVVGYTALRVWDLQNLPENVEDRLPIYRHAGPEALIDSVRFADWGVIETTSADGIQRWDLHTGAYVP